MNRIVIIIVLLGSIYFLYKDSVDMHTYKVKLMEIIKELKNEKNTLEEKIDSLKKALKESNNNLNQTNNDLKQLNENLLKKDSLNIPKNDKIYKEEKKDILNFDKNLKKEELQIKEEEIIKIRPDLSYDKETKELTLEGLKIELKQKF